MKKVLFLSTFLFIMFWSGFSQAKTETKPQTVANKTVSQPKTVKKTKLVSVDVGDDRIFIHPRDNAKSVPFVDIVGRTRTQEFGFMSLDNGTNTTKTIVDVLGDMGGVRYACYVCDTLHSMGYDDWYLPAAYEFKNNFGQFADSLNLSSVYWTSSYNRDRRLAYAYRVQSGQVYETDMLSSYNVRCVRREKIKVGK